MGILSRNKIVATIAGSEQPAETKAGVVKAESPSESWTKVKIQTWLKDKGIEFPSDATKADLLDLT